MLREETTDFLQNVTPFDLLPRESLEGIVEDIGIEYFPRGTRILAQGGPPSENLYVVKKGAVRVYMTSETGEEINIDYRSEGEYFGLLSLLGGDRSRYEVVSVEDTIGFVIPKDRLQDVLHRNPTVGEYFLRSFFIGFIDKTQEETRKRFIGMAMGEKALFTTPVGEVVSKGLITVPADMGLRNAAQIMAAQRTSSLIVVDGEGAAVGIVTDRDLRERVVATGLDLHVPVSAVMSAPLIDVDAEDQCFEALIRMMRRNIHHILVVEGGKPGGVLTHHDLLVLQGSSPMLLVKEVEGVREIEKLGAATPKMDRTVATLLRGGARARNIAVIVTELTEKLLNRVFDLAEEELGPPPLPYALFLSGAGGRREMTLSRSLDMGIVFEGSRDPDRLRAAGRWFDELRKALGLALPACRVSPGTECLLPSDIRTRKDWEKLFLQWDRKVRKGGVRPELVDMRSVRGEGEMVRRLRRVLLDLAKERQGLVETLMEETKGRRPPLAFFRSFVVEKSGEHRSALDLYGKGILPLVDAVRILSLREGVENLSTWGRVRELKERGFPYADETEYALEYLLTLLLHHQLEQIDEKLTPGTVIDPESLSGLERKTLKETFQLTGRVFEFLERGLTTEEVR